MPCSWAPLQCPGCKQTPAPAAGPDESVLTGSYVSFTGSTHAKQHRIEEKRGHSDLNRGPLDLQSNALPLSYTPS